MPVVAIKSQCIKTIMIHLVDKSDFNKTPLQIFAVIPVELAKSEDCNFFLH